jgi:5-methyltetrahydrofolate--homocysteine methyltransferase
MQDYLMPENTTKQKQRCLLKSIYNLINIIGGCCGTTPEHIVDYIAKDYKPRGASVV